ncbi:hypothetical protein HPP92_023593 [Vanilla planifolia]|uniref:Uncharacterized protein n=1 Tax=Vanilla planifolia TaxID=51239 RepID=A0A835PNR1_VANPL|nr:hypothetical protein HPP92_023593 [Vanilla planifolia]
MSHLISSLSPSYDLSVKLHNRRLDYTCVDACIHHPALRLGEVFGVGAPALVELGDEIGGFDVHVALALVGVPILLERTGPSGAPPSPILVVGSAAGEAQAGAGERGRLPSHGSSTELRRRVL